MISLNSILYGSHLAELRLIREIQVCQTRPGHLDLLLVPSDGLTHGAEVRFVKALKQVTNGTMEFHVRRVDHIPRTPGEKFKILIQELDVDWWAGYRVGAAASDARK